MLSDGTVASPEQLAVMEEAFETYCAAHNIANESDREQIARLIVLAFRGGAQTVEEMTAGLERLDAAQSCPSNRVARAQAGLRCQVR